MFKSVLLDIRTKEEFHKGHLCGATLIETPLPPLSKSDIEILRKRLMLLIKKRNLTASDTIYMYCKKGIRAGAAKKIFFDLGYKNVIVLGGVEVEPMKSRIIKGHYDICACK